MIATSFSAVQRLRTMRSPIMKCLAVAAGAVLACSTAFAADSEDRFALKGAGFLPCGVYLQERERQSNIYYMIGGWLDGYLSAHNRYSASTYDVASFETAELLLSVIQNHCEANPGHSLYEVVNSIVQQLQPERIERESTRVEIVEGELSARLYRETIRRMQKKLAQLGLYKEPVHGIYTDPTRSAIMAFQSDLGFATTGFPDQATLWKLLRD